MRRFTAVVTLLVVLATAQGRGAEADPFGTTAARVRMAMAHRDLVASAEMLERLTILALTDDERAVAARLAAIQERLERFWKTVHDGGKTLKGTEDLMIGEAHVAIIEYVAGEGRLVLKVRGQTKRYTSADMPIPVAATLSDFAVRKGTPASDELVGAIHAMDADGDRALARRHWTAAGAATSTLLPELDVPLPAAARVKVPLVTPAAEAVLDPRQWIFQVPAGDGWKRVPLGDGATVNAQRRLEVTAPDDGSTVWLTLGRKLPATFAFKIYVLGLPPGQSCGIFTGAKRGDAPVAASSRLPDDAIEVEFSRKAGSITCRVNGEDCPVEIGDEKAARAQGLFAISLPAGSRVTLAGFEVVPPAKPAK
jgi:hypothetical protein